jgi:hypothetical protein
MQNEDNNLKMRFNKQQKDDIVSFTYQKIFDIVYDNFESIQDMKNYQLRPGYGYNKFYINKVEGGYKNSLQSLIHYILFENLIYRDVLNENQYNQCMCVIKNQPLEIYLPTGDSDEDIEVKEILNYIYTRTINHIAHFLISVGLDVKYEFRAYLKVDDWKDF